MKNILVLCTLVGMLSFSSGCSNEQRCVVQDKIVSAATGAIAGVGQCKKPEVLKAKIEESVAFLRMCSKDHPFAGDKGIVGNLCAMAVPPIIAGILGGVLPTEAECSAEMTKELLEAALKLACAAIPV